MSRCPFVAFDISCQHDRPTGRADGGFEPGHAVAHDDSSRASPKIVIASGHRYAAQRPAHNDFGKHGAKGLAVLANDIARAVSTSRRALDILGTAERR